MTAFFIGVAVGGGAIGSIAFYLWWKHRGLAGYLETTMDALAQGQFHVRAYASQGGQAERLRVSLNRMAQVVEENISKLSQERDVLEHILHSMSTGLVYVTCDGVVDLVNEAAEGMFLRPQEQWLQREHWSLFRQYAIALNVAVDRALLYGTPWRGELAVRDDCLLAVNLIPVVHKNRASAQQSRHDVLLLFNDISDWRRLERMRSDFIANVSHELRTPIAAIRGFAETLLDDADVDTQTRASFMNTIFEESKRMGNLVADLLELSKLERQGQTIQMKAVPLAGVIDRALKRLAKEADSRQISIAVEQTPAMVWADEDKLLQVFLNLMSNAIHYTAEGGFVRIWQDMLVDKVCVHVSDNGIGIPEEHQDRVFERFYRVNHDRSRASGGTGLGLAIVKHIVAAHGGEVGVSSKPGEGSDFWFTIAHLQLHQGKGV